MRPLDIALCLFEMHPPGLYSGSVVGNTIEEYDRIIWLDEVNKKPTWANLNKYWSDNIEKFDKYYA